MRQTPVNDYLEEISTELPEEIYGRLSDAIYETTCDFDEEVGLLKAENAKLLELALGLKWCSENYGCENLCPLYDKSEPEHCREERLLRELGIEEDA